MSVTYIMHSFLYLYMLAWLLFSWAEFVYPVWCVFGNACVSVLCWVLLTILSHSLSRCSAEFASFTMCIIYIYSSI